MRKLIAALVLTCAGTVAHAETALDFPAPSPRATWNNLVLGMTQTDGSIDVVIATRPDPVALGHLLDLLVMNTGFQVRFSVLHDVEARGEVLAQIYAFRDATGTDLHVCRGWWTWPDAHRFAALLRDRFGGSVVFIDNGPSSDAFENPSSDFIAAMRLDPMFAAAASDAPRRVTDGEDYLSALEMFWQQIYSLNEHEAERLLARGGWIDGCGERS